jgi:hypothetical protein
VASSSPVFDGIADSIDFGLLPNALLAHDMEPANEADFKVPGFGVRRKALENGVENMP